MGGRHQVSQMEVNHNAPVIHGVNSHLRGLKSSPFRSQHAHSSLDVHVIHSINIITILICVIEEFFHHLGLQEVGY
jgi:hypothetical protein